MRLTGKYIVTLTHSRRKGNKSEYAGTEIKRENLPDFSGTVYPVSDEKSVALYGERIHRMYGIYCLPECDLTDGDFVGIPGEKEEFKIVSVMRYSTHIYAVAERSR
ncbi:MAG: hypothetical protein ACI4KR_00730 [Ruminiclostridium sp.]